MKLTIVHEFPPNYDIIKMALPEVEGNKRVIFTYGPTVYYPHGTGSIADHLKVHEATHTRQQGDDPNGWWNEYLADAEFRLDQEIEAYQNQYRFFKSKNHNIGEQRNFLSRLAADLCSPIYGELIQFGEALKIIKNQ